MRLFYLTSLLQILFCLIILPKGVAQTTIQWQKSIGTPQYDNGLKIFNDESGNFVVLGTELHEDITGNFRTYLVAIKFDTEGNEIWKKYHDVAHETHSIPVDYYIGDHFYAVEHHQTLIQLVVSFQNQLILYKLVDATGDFYSYETLPSPLLAIYPDNAKVQVSALCAVQQSCYGPDSLVVQKINAIPDSNFNVIAWTFGLKQDVRTTPIQGHYDFDNNDVAIDEDGNVYLLTQIERWDFQFCTDCADAFIDAYSMVYKFSPDGEEIKHVRINTTSAVVSSLRFLSVTNGQIIIREDDINNAGTALLTTIYTTNYDLIVQEKFDLHQNYNHVVADANGSLYTVTNVYDPLDPNIKGESDVLVSKFTNEGDLEWKSYYGGSSFDFPKGFVLTSDGGIAFIANTESNDFDVAENQGWQDIWLVKLRQNLVSVNNEGELLDFSFSPHPATDAMRIISPADNLVVLIYNLTGTELIHRSLDPQNDVLQLGTLIAGSYIMKLTDGQGRSAVRQFVKI